MNYEQMLQHIANEGVAGWKDTDGSVMRIRRVGGRMELRWSNEYEWVPSDLEQERSRWVGETFDALAEMIDNQPSKVDVLKDYLPTDSDLERLSRLIDLADSVETSGSFLLALDELCDHTDSVAAACQRLRSRARKELG